ncbi:MAG: hypothetical protein U1G07_11405 [Verrucomicrobiota bacterium]
MASSNVPLLLFDPGKGGDAALPVTSALGTNQQRYGQKKFER